MAANPISTLQALSQPKSGLRQNSRRQLVTSLLGANVGVGTGPSRQIIQSLAQLDQRRSILSKSAVGIIEGGNLVEAATDALKSQRSTLQKIETALKSAGGEMSEEDRSKLQININKLVTELSNKAEKTTYQGVAVLSENENRYVVSLSGRGSRSLTINLVAATPESLGVNNLDVSSPETATQALGSVKTALESVVRGHDGLLETYKKLSKAADNVQKELNKIIQTQQILDPEGAVSVSANSTLSRASFSSNPSTNQMMLANLAYFL